LDGDDDIANFRSNNLTSGFHSRIVIAKTEVILPLDRSHRTCYL
jgi:hypothetical protein